MKLDSIQPTQLYISSAKLDHVMNILKQSEKVDIERIPVKKLGGSARARYRTWKLREKLEELIDKIPEPSKNIVQRGKLGF